MIKIQKHVDEDGNEYIQAGDVLKGTSEFDPKIQQAYTFLLLMERVLNYFVAHRSTAFGNPDLARAEGCVVGFCMAKGWDYEDTAETIRIKRGTRTIFLIEKPAIPSGEREWRRGLAADMEELGL